VTVISPALVTLSFGTCPEEDQGTSFSTFMNQALMLSLDRGARPILMPKTRKHTPIR